MIDDDAVRSLVLSTRLLGTREIMIINHTDCGMLRFTDRDFEARLRTETGQAVCEADVLARTSFAPPHGLVICARGRAQPVPRVA